MSMQQQFKLGERGYHLFANEYNGEPKVHIRKIYQDPSDGRSIITRYGITLSVDEWNDLKRYVLATDHQLVNLSRQASMTSAVPGPVKVKQPKPYQRLSAKTAKPMNIDTARNNTSTCQDIVPNTIDELFNATLQDY